MSEYRLNPDPFNQRFELEKSVGRDVNIEYASDMGKPREIAAYMTRIVETIGQAGEPALTELLEYEGYPTEGHDLGTIQKAYLDGVEVFLLSDVKGEKTEYVIGSNPTPPDVMARLGYELVDGGWTDCDGGVDTYYCSFINHDITSAYDELADNE